MLTQYTAKVCQGQTETGEADAMFVLENGATLANVCDRIFRVNQWSLTQSTGHHWPQPGRGCSLQGHLVSSIHTSPPIQNNY